MIGTSGTAGQPRGHINELSGPVSGSAVQVRDVFGGIHLHSAEAAIPVPRQLPRPGPLVNRTDSLAALGQGSPGDGVVIVNGPAGIGKTELVVHWAHSMLSHFPDGQLFIDLQGHSAAGPVRPNE